MIYKKAAKKVHDIAESAGSESKLQIGLEEILRDLLAHNGIVYDPSVNESLSSLGFSQMSSDRPDSLFGHVVLDYKEPGLLRNPSLFQKSRIQVERYLNEVSGGGPLENPGEAEKWAGILWDGIYLSYCHASGDAWIWSEKHETSEASLKSLVQIYRSLRRMPLTPQLLTKKFGKDSDLAKDVIPILANQLSKPKHRTNLLFKEWKRLFQQVSTYGLSQLPSLKEWSQRNGVATRDASQILFAMHTYYSVIVKLLTAEILGASQIERAYSIVDVIANAPDDDALYKEIDRIENGDLFRRYRIDNFLEGDFFSWYSGEESSLIAGCLRSIAETFQEFEPATQRLKPEVVKDLLKEFYSSLIDEQIRHDLGEYYTPDWLAEYLIDVLGYEGDPNKKIVDPTCGSGTFIVECIKRLRLQCENKGYSPLEILHTILGSIRGLDLNPLAVISARANYVLAISDLVFSLGQDIEIPIYLADAINVPVENADGLMEFTLDTEVGDVKLKLPRILLKEQVLGKILLKCEEYISLGRSSSQFINSLARNARYLAVLDDNVKACLVDFFEKIQQLDRRDPPWDSIWCRIVKNNFSPLGFDSVDYIVGNPPWVRWSRLPSTYRHRVKRFCDYYGLVSGRGYSGGIESDISTVLTFSVIDHWLKKGGRIGFLITSSVFKSASATGFRKGKLPDSSGILINRIEDLSKTQPFPDATNETSIYIATKVDDYEDAISLNVPSRIWIPQETANISPNISLSEVMKKIELIDGEACPVGEFGSPFFIGKRADFDEVSSIRGRSEDLMVRSHRGTVTDLARVYWVKVEKYSPETNRAWIRTLSTKELPIAREIEKFEGWIEADVLFPLIRGRDVGRYSHKTEGWYQIIPNRHYSRFESENEFSDKYPATYSYLMNYSKLLPNRSTYKRYLSELPIYSIYCIGDYSFGPYKVVWLEQQNPNKFRASVISNFPDSSLPNDVFVPDHKLYFISATSLEEAHYLCSYLNSHPVRTFLGGFLLGKQIGTTIFKYLNIPEFDSSSSDHQRLVSISVDAHEARSGDKDTNLLLKSKELELQTVVLRIAEGSSTH